MYKLLIAKFGFHNFFFLRGVIQGKHSHVQRCPPKEHLTTCLQTTLKMAAVPSDVYGHIYSFLVQQKLLKAAKAFRKEALVVSTILRPFGILLVFFIFQCQPNVHCRVSLDIFCSHVANKFPCTGSKACCVGESSQHLLTHIREHLSSDKNSHFIF